MTEIETLLPQRYPFLFVDQLLSATAEEIVGSATYSSSFPFYQELSPTRKIVPHVILIESIVQCGGAGVTQMGIFKKASWGLATLENVHFFDYVEPNATVKMIVKTLKVSSKLLKQTGTAFCDGRRILEATWLCLQLND